MGFARSAPRFSDSTRILSRREFDGFGGVNGDSSQKTHRDRRRFGGRKEGRKGKQGQESGERFQVCLPFIKNSSSGPGKLIQGLHEDLHNGA